MKADEPETDPLEEKKPKESQCLLETEIIPQKISTEPRVIEMPIETMLQTMGYKLSTFTQQESPQEPTEPSVEEIQEVPFPVPIVEVEMKEWEPTEEVGSRVSTPDGRERGGREGTKRTDSSAGESTIGSIE